MVGKIINTNQPLMESEASSRQPNSAGALPDNDKDVSVQVDYGALIDKAIQRPQKDTQLVQQARKLLLSGQLESDQNIREAAQNILKFGI
jgi:hypothetical protein